MKERSKTTKTIVGAVTLGIVFVAILITFQGRRILSGTLKSYEVEFDDVLNVVPQSSAVRVDGVNVGTVTETRQEGTTGVVEIGIDPEIELKADATARLRLQSILGQKYIDLDPGVSTDPLEGRIGIGVTDGARDLGELLGQASPALSGLDADEIEETLELANETTDKYAPGLGESIESAAATLETLVQNQAEIFGVINNLEVLTTTLVEETRNLAQITASVQTTIDQIRAFAAEQGPRMLSILNDVLTIKNLLDRNIAAFDAARQKTPVLLGLTRELVNLLIDNILNQENPVPVAVDNFGDLLIEDRRPQEGG